MILREFARAHGLSSKEAENQEVGGLEGGNGDIIQVLVAIHHVAADHRAQLNDGNAEFFGCFRF